MYRIKQRPEARISRRIVVALTAFVLAMAGQAIGTPSSGAAATDNWTLSAPQSGTSSSVSWTGGPLTGAGYFCTTVSCGEHQLTLDIPADYWATRDGAVTIDLTWPNKTDDFDLIVKDKDGTTVASSAWGLDQSEQVRLDLLEPGTYRVLVYALHAVEGTYNVTATLSVDGSTGGPGSGTPMAYPETRKAIEDELVQEYPLNVIFVGRNPTASEVADLKSGIPAQYKPTVSSKSTNTGADFTQAGAPLLNWNKNRSASDKQPYFLGITYKYKLNILTASDEYAKALFQVAEDHTAQAQEYRTGKARANHQAEYDATSGNFRVLAKGGDASYKVTEPTKTDLVDAYAVENWIFDSRLDAKWSCAFTNLETQQCVAASVVNPDTTAYHDPFYDKNGLNLDRMPQGRNNGSSYLFFDTFTPDYAKDYFRPNAYHTYGTDKVIDGKIIPKSVEKGGSWRITDPDTGSYRGMDFGRTWGGRYRFHFVDLGAAPNDYEDAAWANYGAVMSSDYPHGDPPVWQYDADPKWRQQGETCATDQQNLPWQNDTPCRMGPRLARDVAYGLFFRSTAGYLYRPIPRGDVNWLAVSNWTDFYSRPQWVNGVLTNGGGVYGTWWTNSDKVYKIGDAADGSQQDDTLRWMSSATPYTRWVGRKGESVPIYDPTNNQPTGKSFDASPKYADLPAPEHHVQVAKGEDATGESVKVVPEPLYGGEHVHAHYGEATVDLTEISNMIEKAKATGTDVAHDLAGTAQYDGAVSATVMRDYIDAHPEGIADRVDGVNTIPSINMVFEKAYTWSLPAIVGGIAYKTADGEAWGVFNNLNDRVSPCESHYPAATPGTTQPGTKASLTDQCLPTQQGRGGMSYTVEHEAAHNLGLSHPHDGSLGVDKCPEGDPKAGQWECYWRGLGWMYDISAAPTTYAMAYRPYEVEDQDNLQRGHVAEYLISAQQALRERLATEAAASRTTPTAAWTADFDRMKTWRAKAGTLFREGDYLHAEYAARNGSLAARGFPQTSANTSDPKLVGAGQILYFNVHPEGSGVAKTNLKSTDLTAAQAKPRQTMLTATVSNTTDVSAAGVVVEFKDGTAIIGTTVPVAVAAGQTVSVTLPWDTAGVKGDRLVTATIDPANAIDESDETDNALTRTITVKGNKITNGSFEESSSGDQPDGWTSNGASYDTSGSHAGDGTDAIGLRGALVTPASVTSAPIAVRAGESYELAATVVSGPAPVVSVAFLDAAGATVGPVVSPATTLAARSGIGLITGQVTVPAGASQVRLTLAAATSLPDGQTTWLDDVWLW